MIREKSEKLNIAGPLIRRLRKHNEWTQDKCAQLLREVGWKDCHRGWVSRLESGNVTLRDVDLPYLRLVFGERFTKELSTLVDKAAEHKAPKLPAGAARLVNVMTPCLLFAL